MGAVSLKPSFHSTVSATFEFQGALLDPETIIASGSAFSHNGDGVSLEVKIEFLLPDDTEQVESILGTAQDELNAMIEGLIAAAREKAQDRFEIRNRGRFCRRFT